MLLADRELSKRLERAEGQAAADFARARGGDACVEEIGGTIAIYDTPQSPVTQTFGLGLFETPMEESLDRAESFFRSRKAQIHHEVSPHADAALWPLFTKRGYTPIEFSSILYRELEGAAQIAKPTAVEVELTRDVEAWSRLAMEGWSEFFENKEEIAELMGVVSNSRSVLLFIASLDARQIATAAMNIQDDVALLAGASTIPDARCRGAQAALLTERLRHAAAAGCTVAAMGAQVGSGSQRNAERNGFRIAYTRTKWALPDDA